MIPYSRRGLLGGAAALTSAPLIGFSNPAPRAPPAQPQTAATPAKPAPTPPSSQPAKSQVPSELMLYCAVRLTFANSAGTGFIYPFFNNNGRCYYGIVSNRHVFEIEPDACKIIFSDECQFYDEGYFSLTLQKPDGTPDTGNVTAIHMTNIRKRIILHPTVDLVVYFITDVINQLVENKTPPYIVPITPDIIPHAKQWADFTPLEDIVTVGYPGFLWDNVNVLPLFHSGRTASPVYIDFQGRKEFLVDTATWPGASGSPVFIYNQGTVFDPRTRNVTFGERVYFVGVVYGVGRQEVDGSVVIVNAPTHAISQTPFTSAVAIPTNLGACIRSTRILEFEPVMAKLGMPVPAGYVMRDAAS